MKLNITVLSAIVVASASVQAVQINPAFETFGPLPGATFGGSGIPNHAVAVSDATVGIHTVTVGLTAHQRFSNPPVGNDGAGTFYAVTGNDAANGQPTYARWNVGFYLDFDPAIALSDEYSVNFYYDKDPAFNNDVSTFLAGPLSSDWQDSWNLGMGFFAGAPAFDPNAPGEYDFMLQVLHEGNVVASTAISVVVNVPEGGSSVALLGLGALALCGLGFRKQAA